MNTPIIESVQNTSADIQLLRQLSTTTFVDTFAAQNSEADLQAYLQTHLSFEQLQQEVNNPDSAFYFLKEGNNAIGYLKVNFGNAQTTLNDSKALEVERIYVLKDYFGKKAGQLLLDKAFEIATEKQLDYIWLGVWEKNDRAIHFYEKNGFTTFGSHVFTLGSDDQTDVLMKCEVAGVV